MRWKRRQFRHWPMACKLAIVFSVLLTVIIAVVGGLSYQMARRAMERQINHYIPQVLDQVNVRLDDYVNDVKFLSRAVMVEPYNGLLEEAFSGFGRSGPEPGLADTLSLHRALSFISLNPNKDYVAVLFYTGSGQVYIRQSAGGLWLDASYRDQPWFRNLDLDQYTPTVLGTIPFRLFGDNPYIGEWKAFSVVQPLRQKNRKALKGIIQIVGTLEPIREIMRGINFGTGTRQYVFDDRNQIVYASDDSLAGAIEESAYGMQGAESATSGSSRVTLDGESVLVSYNRSSASGWRVVSVIPLGNIMQEVEQVKEWIGIWITAGVAAVILLSSLLSVRMTDPLRRLARTTRRQVHLSASPLSPEPGGDDEVGQLGQTFRHMMRRVQTLLNEMLKEKLIYREAEIRTLQSQIHPHFLHNTLETIRMTIRTGNSERGEQGLVELGQLLRYHASSLQETVQVQAEIQFIHSYLSIQRFRYGDRLSFKLDVDEELGEVHLPGLLLQPLVENAIIHGVSPVDQRIRITVRLKRQGGYMICSVIDEGPGIPPDRLDALLASLRQETGAAGKRIGLENVYQRIQLIYGDQAEFHMESMDGAGTIVGFSIPLEGERSTAKEECHHESADCG
ncbi:cache domain-containing sensor histidine kinase [Paenibacillus silagei]|uniref:histidine kinase n=1 Tax=Paenibacillus silagei TaxID=1670801 RepID=A0ABS4NKM5_9BACL|nr:two-component system sensor histidine kinase YesM [Paenibacillus silagei]